MRRSSPSRGFTRPPAEILLVVTTTKVAHQTCPWRSPMTSSMRRETRTSSRPNSPRIANSSISLSKAGALDHGIGRSHFESRNPSGSLLFQESMSLYDSIIATGIGRRRSRTRSARLLATVWDTWFNPSNDHPWDGNPRNTSPENFRPYRSPTILDDLLVLYQMLRDVPPRVADNRRQHARRGPVELLAMQHPPPR